MGEKDEETTVITGKNILLKLFEEKSKESWLANPEVKSVLSYSEFLCGEDPRKHVTAILDAYDKQQELCRQVLTAPLSDIGDSRDFRVISEFLRRTNLRLDFYQPRRKWKSSKQKKKADQKYAEDLAWQLVQAVSKDFENRLKGNDKEMMRHERELQKVHSRLHLLKPTNVLVCPKCRQPFAEESSGQFGETTDQPLKQVTKGIALRCVMWGEFKGTRKCETCKTEVTRKNARRIAVHEIDEDIVKMFRQNLWFEEYFARVLESLGWKVWKRPRVMGMSGILHEIDAVGIKNGYVVCAECKTSKRVNREEVFTFAVKLADIKAHFGVLAMLGSPAESETKEFLAKNPAMLPIEGIAIKTRETLAQDLKSTTIGRI
jgi:hypothetical protein